MKCAPILTLVLFAFFPRSSFSQEYSYSHYDMNDGLAGTTAYCITQDSYGFIWVGTESGVSRFDGTRFKNFTTADGLPDIEVLQIFGDSKGRVWMAPFRKSVCYYYQGSIHNPSNDPLLAKIRLKGNVEGFAEDAGGNILIQERVALHLLCSDSSVREIDSIDHQAIRESVAVCRSNSGDFLIQEGNRVLSWSHGRFIPFCDVNIKGIVPNYIAMSAGVVVFLEDQNRTVIKSFVTGKVAYRQQPPKSFEYINFSVISDSLVYFDESSGATEFNVRTGASRRWLPGRQVSRVFRDDEGSLWFTTLDEGLYRLNSQEFKNITIPVDAGSNSSIYAIHKAGRELLVGGSYNALRRLTLPELNDCQRAGIYLKQRNRVLFVDSMKSGHIITASDYGMHIDFGHLTERRVPLGIKSVFRKSEGELLIGTGWGAAVFDLNRFRIRDTLWNERCTAIYFRNDTTFIGTLNGLYLLKKDKSYTYAGQTIPFLQKRISSIAESADGTLWIGSYDDGIIAYKNGRQTAAIASRQGLTSDICRTLYIHRNYLWVGTNKGLNKIDLSAPGYPVTCYTANDGLGSDVINSVLMDSSIVYVGTGAGLTVFDEARKRMTDSCRLYLLGVMNAGKERIRDTSHLSLPYSDKRVRFDFAAISYKSAGNITYEYRLKGLDQSWTSTRENFLEYLTLPSGNYILELKAVNKFGVYSHPLSLSFEVITPFWQSAWFYVFLLFLFLGFTWLFVAIRIRSIRRRQEEKEMLGKQLIEMEHMALQSQMNPHFIFNCLNSIQQYIFDQDMYAANKYLTGFSNLVRATLQHSAQSYISLEEEINYLFDYLSLEKLRFKEKMDYSIVVDPAINKKTTFIPPMLIQPYVENSIRHGIRPQSNNIGNISVVFKAEGDKLAVCIEDNGIGRERARSYRTSEHIEYQSRGMSLTADRIRLINEIHGNGIHLKVIDLKDGDDQALGTKVVIHFPRFEPNS